MASVGRINYLINLSKNNNKKASLPLPFIKRTPHSFSHHCLPSRSNSTSFIHHSVYHHHQLNSFTTTSTHQMPSTSSSSSSFDPNLGFESNHDHQRFTNPIIKSDNDQRDYQIIKLNNQLQVILIHDPKADKAAAALSVNVGHLSDPPQLPGLAHFCEHLLFMGNKKVKSSFISNLQSI